MELSPGAAACSAASLASAVANGRVRAGSILCVELSRWRLADTGAPRSTHQDDTEEPTVTRPQRLSGESSTDFWVAEAFASLLHNNETRSPRKKLRHLEEARRRHLPTENESMQVFPLLRQPPPPLRVVDKNHDGALSRLPPAPNRSACGCTSPARGCERWLRRCILGGCGSQAQAVPSRTAPIARSWG